MKKLLIVTLLSICVLTGCGNGISQKDYDEVTEERDKLKSENESIKRLSELEVKVAEYSAKIDTEYEHAKFVLHVAGKVTNIDVSENVQDIEELYVKTSKSINAVKEIFKTVDNLTDMNDDTYNTTINSVEDIYNAWEDAYNEISNIQEQLVKD